MVKIADVFTPTSPPKPELFVDRDEVKDLNNIIEVYKTTAIVFGPSGVGKTSLVEYLIILLYWHAVWLTTPVAYFFE